MKRFMIAALSLLLVWTVTRLFAQEPPAVELFQETLPDETAAAAEPAVESAQQNRYLEIMRTKAELMSDAELESAIQQAEAEIENLQASRMLTDARETLLRVIETYPETPAAQDARRMLALEVEPTIEAVEPIRIYDDLERSFTFPAESTGFDTLPDIEAPRFDSSE